MEAIANRLSVTAACKLAGKNVYLSAFGRQYVVITPAKYDGIDGPVRESQPMDFWSARKYACEAKAALAVFMITGSYEKAWEADAEVNYGTPWREAVRAVVSK